MIPFTSLIPSSTPIAVGREIIPPGNIASVGNLAPRDYSSESFSNATDFLPKTVDLLPSQEIDHQQLPGELESIPSNSIETLIFFSVPSSQPFLRALERKFPSARIMGLIASSTTFETGRQSTLFRNRWIGGQQGAVGLAIPNRSNVRSYLNPAVRYPAMANLGLPMRVTASKGNIILALDSQKATQCLLNLIRELDQAGRSSTTSDLIISKEKEFYLGFLDNETQQLVEVCRITGGSTTRGAMAIDREKKIAVNQIVQILHLSRPTEKDQINVGRQPIWHQSEQNGSSRIEFECRKTIDRGDKLPPIKARDSSGHAHVEILDNLFLTGSEFGFIPQHRQIVDIEHAKAILDLD